MVQIGQNWPIMFLITGEPLLKVCGRKAADTNDFTYKPGNATFALRYISAFGQLKQGATSQISGGLPLTNPAPIGAVAWLLSHRCMACC